MMRLLICVTVCVLTPCTAYAEVMVGNTAEGISHESSLIALATPVEVTTGKGPGDVQFTTVRLRMDEVIKGPVSSGDTVTIYDYSYGTVDAVGWENAKTEKKQLLVFALVARNIFKEINGKYALTMCHEGKSAYYADRKVSGLFTPEFTQLTEFNSLLDRTRKHVAAEVQFLNAYQDGKVEMKSLEVPFESEAFKHLYAGSSCFLRVPEYLKPKDIPKHEEGKSGTE